MGDDDNKIGPLPDRAGDIPGANGHRTYGHGGMRAAKSSLDGGGGTGFGDRPIAVGGDPDPSHHGRGAATAYPVTTASAPFANHLGMGVWPVSVSLNSEDVYRFLNRLRGDLIWLAKRIASPVAFMVGVIVGLIESLWDLVRGVYELAKLIRTLILALMYAIEKTAKDYHWSKPAGYSLELFVKIELLLSTAGALSSFTLGTDDEKREAYELVQAIIGEVGKLFKGNLWDKLCAFLGKKGDEVSDAWHKFEALVNSGEPGQEYEAGEMAGKVAGEVIMTIFAFLAIARKIGLVARLARVFGLVGASEAELMAAIEALEAAQASTGNRELEAAIKELRAAIEEVKAAKETGRAAKAAADRLRAATKRLTDTTKAIEDQLAKDAANLKKAAEQVEEKTAKKGSKGTGAQDPPSEKPRNRKGWRTEPDPKKRGGKPRGKRTTNTKNEAPAKKRSIELENQSADRLANAGYDVEQNPDVPGKKNPDYKINGEVFDNYSPRESTSARNIVEGINEKVSEGQADRIVLNMADSDVTRSELRSALSEFGSSDLKEIIMIDKDGNVVRFYP